MTEPCAVGWVLPKQYSHSDVRLTLNTYTNADFAEQVDAVNRLQAVPLLRSAVAPTNGGAKPKSERRKKNSNASQP